MHAAAQIEEIAVICTDFSASPADALALIEKLVDLVRNVAELLDMIGDFMLRVIAFRAVAASCRASR